MNDDWSDAWLQQAAGWKAVKEGRAIHARGLVSNARFDDELCSGMVGGQKPRRVKVRRVSATIAETSCGCPENQRSGAMCEHAVAIILAARDKPSDSPVVTPEQVRPVLKVMPPSPAYRVLWFPSWEREWASHRGTVRVEKSERLPDEADEALHAWAHHSGLTAKQLPWMLSMRGADWEEFLSAIQGHGEILVSKQTIVCNEGLPKIRVASVIEREGWLFRLEDDAGQFLGNQLSRWWRKNEQLFEFADHFEAEFLFQLFTEKYARITHEKWLLSDTLKRILIPCREGDPLEQWQSIPVRPTWGFALEGSLRQMRLKVEKRYEVEDRQWSCAMGQTLGFLRQISNKCFYAVHGDQITMETQLRDAGWSWHEERDEWHLEGEDGILAFLSEGRAQLESMAGHFSMSPQLTHILERTLIVKPDLQIHAKSASEASLQLSFSTQQGKPLDPAKIRALLQSGKRLIQTNDGNSLVLPQQSWEIFQRSISDLHLVQKQGEYLAKNHEVLAVEYLRKYFNQTLHFNDLLSSTKVNFPLLQADLRDYQAWGASWLHDRLTSYGFALLADEMGLGKTLQTIALLTLWASPANPALVVVPTSLLHNWQSEISRFAPHLETVVLHGADRDELHAQATQSVIVTSYGILMNDRALFMKREFSLMVLDEASAIRNPDTELARCCFRMKARYKLALTGTPLENSVRDLWSIFQFLQPGYLGERETFREQYERAQTANTPAMQSLRIRVMPFLLRRTKEQVAKDLPSKIITDDWCDLSPDQARLYQSVWEAGMEKIEQQLAKNDSAVQMSVLTLLLRLRQICCDAALLDPELAQSWTIAQRSRKMERLFELIQGAQESGRKMLVFSQFATQLALIEQECRMRQTATLRLDGATRDRRALIEKFQQADGPSVFLISLKAGGYGLNLTQASTVVHFDPWWNPAAEQQATDRAHRIGQTQTVNVYRMLTRGSVEERVMRLQAEKARMAENLLGAGSAEEALAGAPNLQDMKDLLHKARL